MLARPDIQASLSRILVSVPSLPHLLEPTEIFVRQNRIASATHFAVMAIPLNRPQPRRGRRCSLSISTTWSIHDASFDSSAAGAIPITTALRLQHRKNNTARKVSIRRQCHTSAHLADAKVRSSGLFEMKFAPSPLSSCRQTHSTFNKLCAAHQQTALTNTVLGYLRTWTTLTLSGLGQYGGPASLLNSPRDWTDGIVTMIMRNKCTKKQGTLK